MSGVVVCFIGGPLDGQTLAVLELTPRCNVPVLRGQPLFQVDPDVPFSPLDLDVEEYLLVKDLLRARSYYVERRLLEMSRVADIDPLPQVE